MVALAGGTGSAKLLRGLARLPVELTVVSNTGDNFWVYGVYVCPDVDIAAYTLAGLADARWGWGVAGDTFEALTRLSRLGFETWFKLGDRDLALCLARTELLRRGKGLTEATDSLRRALGVRVPILPVTDGPVETRIATSRGDLHLQEFWVREKGRPKVLGVTYRGAGRAHPSKNVVAALNGADRILICPANPITSIGPMLAVGGMRRLLEGARGRVVALSPMAGRGPFSGPAGKFMSAAGLRPDSLGVAGLYSRFVDRLLISELDAALAPRIGELGVGCIATDTMMGGPADEARVAKEMLEA